MTFSLLVVSLRLHGSIRLPFTSSPLHLFHPPSLTPHFPPSATPPSWRLFPHQDLGGLQRLTADQDGRALRQRDRRRARRIIDGDLKAVAPFDVNPFRI